jgi:hypothetical protein
LEAASAGLVRPVPAHDPVLVVSGPLASTSSLLDESYCA